MRLTPVDRWDSIFSRLEKKSFSKGYGKSSAPEGAGRKS